MEGPCQFFFFDLAPFGPYLPNTCCCLHFSTCINWLCRAGYMLSTCLEIFCLWLTVVVDFSTSDFDRRQSVKTLLTPRSCNWKMEMEKGWSITLSLSLTSGKFIWLFTSRLFSSTSGLWEPALTFFIDDIDVPLLNVSQNWRAVVVSCKT